MTDAPHVIFGQGQSGEFELFSPRDKTHLLVRARPLMPRPRQSREDGTSGPALGA